MLTKASEFTCIVCGRGPDHPDYAWGNGRSSDGPAYWSERGAMCSAACALSHGLKRAADGDAMSEPADPPFQVK